MRGYFLLLFLFFFLPVAVFAETADLVSENLNVCQIVFTLKLGSVGEQVKCLQKKVGVVVDGRFGPLTQAAVVSFQQKNNLIPDGIVGPKTRGIFQQTFFTGNLYPPGCNSFLGYSTETGVRCDVYLKSKEMNPEIDNSQIAEASTEKSENINKNLEDVDGFVNAVVSYAREKGYSEKELQTIASSFREELLNSKVDYNEEFKNMLIKEASLASSSSSVKITQLFSTALSFLGGSPSVARAAVVPFGGKLISTYFCATSGNWIIYLTPLPPSFAPLLSYYSGTQGFASYNMPFTSWMLGAYEPPGVCSYGYVNIPTYGTITPVVGSSPY